MIHKPVVPKSRTLQFAVLCAAVGIAPDKVVDAWKLAHKYQSWALTDYTTKAPSRYIIKRSKRVVELIFL